jgi:hypothetical protein
MYTMHEAYARERMREEHERSQRAHVATEVAAERRWHRWEMHARAAQRRHAHRVQHVASAVAETNWR